MKIDIAFLLLKAGTFLSIIRCDPDPGCPIILITAFVITAVLLNFHLARRAYIYAMLTYLNPGLYDIKLEVISSTGCSDVLDSLEVVRVTGDTEFTISKLKSDSSEVSEFNDMLLCNDEIILLRNISIHQPTCPSCFDWDISGSPEYFQVNEAEGTLLFSYSDDIRQFLLSKNLKTDTRFFN